MRSWRSGQELRQPVRLLGRQDGDRVAALAPARTRRGSPGGRASGLPAFRGARRRIDPWAGRPDGPGRCPDLRGGVVACAALPAPASSTAASPSSPVSSSCSFAWPPFQTRSADRACVVNRAHRDRRAVFRRAGIQVEFREDCLSAVDHAIIGLVERGQSTEIHRGGRSRPRGAFGSGVPGTSLLLGEVTFRRHRCGCGMSSRRPRIRSFASCRPERAGRRRLRHSNERRVCHSEMSGPEPAPGKPRGEGHDSREES